MRAYRIPPRRRKPALLLALAALAGLGLGAESAARHLFFRREIQSELEASRGAPKGVALAGYVKPDFLWLSEAFYLAIVNQSGEDLRTGVLEVDGGWRCLLREADPASDGDLPRGRSASLRSDYWMSNVTMKKEDQARRLDALPRRLVLYTDQGTYTWTIGRR